VCSATDVVGWFDNLRMESLPQNPYTNHPLVEDFLTGQSPWEILAFINKDEMLATNAPFVWSLNPYYKNNKQYRCSIDSHQFTLLDISVYYDDGTNVEYKKKYRENFKKYNKKLFNTLLGPNNYNATKQTGSSSTGISINTAGVSGTNANLPPYYALAFIMKA
jgi:hypothetical protein